MNIHSARRLETISTVRIYFSQYTLSVYNVLMIWDEDKREKVIRERNIDFARILDIFNDAFAVDFQDLEHTTSNETRYKISGMTACYGLITLV